MKHLYSYEGPVMEYGECVNRKWRSETVAESERKAYSNLCHKFRMQTNRPINRPLTLPGKLKIEK